jgi:8-oxo-dGTP pyrophosphatase MutT (NUDIX family)
MRLADRLRASLAGPASEPMLPGDQASSDDRPGEIAAAVLIALTDRPDPGAILTVRREHLRTHAGQVAFPGGRIDPGEDSVAAALREADEELGVPPDRVEVIGELAPYATITNYAVTPVLAVVPPDLMLSPHEPEVADWFEAPLAFLLDPANQQRRAVMFDGAERHYYQIDWNGRRIWGATAAMIVNLGRRLQWR